MRAQPAGDDLSEESSRPWSRAGSDRDLAATAATYQTDETASAEYFGGTVGERASFSLDASTSLLVRAQATFTEETAGASSVYDSIGGTTHIDGDRSSSAASTSRSRCGRGRGVLITALLASIVVNVAAIAAASVGWVFERQAAARASKSTNAPGANPNAALNKSCPYAGRAPVRSLRAGINASVTGFNHEAVELCWEAVLDSVRIESPYIVLADDWWTNSTVMRPMHATSNQSWTLNNLLPDTVYRMQVMVHDGYLVAAASDPSVELTTDASQVFAVRTLPRGGCGNRDDLTIYKENGNTLIAGVQSCFLSHLLSKPAAVKCMTDDVGITEACGTCWYDFSSCGATSCLAPCTTPLSAECANCLSDLCGQPQVDCGGIPAWAFLDSNLVNDGPRDSTKGR